MLLAPVDERQNDRHQAGGHQHGADHIDPVTGGAARFGDQARGGRQRGCAHRQVDQEAASPVKAEDVGLDQQATEELPEDRGQAKGHAVGGDRGDPLASLVGDPDQGERLRPGEGGTGALDRAARDEDRRVIRQPASQ